MAEDLEVIKKAKGKSFSVNSSGFNLNSFKEITQLTTKEDVGLEIMTWGLGNYFPQSFKNVIDQSATAKPAVSRTAKFFKGGPFVGEDIIINTYGLTLRDIVDKCADDLALFDGFAINTNWNYYGQVTGIIPLRVEQLRFNIFDELNFSSKIGYHRNFGGNDPVEKAIKSSVTKAEIKFINVWNPKYALDQIDKLENGLSDYNGQILYYSGAGSSTYPIPPLQSSINYVLSDVENSILVRKETSTGFISNYILKTMLDYEDPNLITFENSIAEMQGARGVGKILTIAGLTEEEMGQTMLEEIGGGNNSAIIDSAQKTYDLDKKVINGAYLIPPILSGTDVPTGFSTEALKDAYNVFNAITEQGRDRIEKEINKILAVGDFEVKSIKLTKLKLDFSEEGEETNEEIDSDKTMVADNSTLTNLTGRQMQNISRIVRKFNKDELSYDQASTLLKGGFGFDDEAVDTWLITEEEEIEESAAEGEPQIKL